MWHDFWADRLFRDRRAVLLSGVAREGWQIILDRRYQEAGLGGVLGRFRQAANLTQHELAALAGLSLGAVRDLEQGRTRRPANDTLTALSMALGLNSAQVGELERAAAARGT